MATYQVVDEHRASYPYAVELKVGDQVVVTAKEEGGWVWCIGRDARGAWVPNGYLERRGEQGTVRVAYSSAELTVRVGDRVSCSREAEGWLWCVSQTGERGWIPKAKLRRR